ncbi:DEP domain-containing protein 1B-like isoform X1 [Pristis pectinata]|uniref:DEP domain-containing protein 1B-like isoform X1 n=1 Tax=Pristis pectinata TaxID=685728 RepID=UPI00223E8010|nr:DEP domain-containing protein 1B-like isoform X1 [Pristis pectinata]
MESRIISPGPYRATKLWNELIKLFRAGMPLKKHTVRLRKYNNCFTASEAVDWLHELLRNNSNFGPDVTRQQTLQLLRKFLKNRVIEDIKGRWGAENVDDNSQLYRFPTTSPLKVVPSHPPFYQKNTTGMSNKKKSQFCPLPKEVKIPQVNTEELDKEVPVVTSDEHLTHVRPVTQSDIEEAWREIVLNHLQKILGLASLDDVLDFSQVVPQNIVYNVCNISKHGVVILQDKSEDLPHWVLSAMKCLANWPRHNDLNQPTYPGFERDVFKTVADYFISLPEPLLTFEHYELFVNILVLCGYIMISNRQQGKRKNLDEHGCLQPTKSQHLNSHKNSFKSTECLLLSLIRKDISEEPTQQQEEFDIPEQKLFRNEHNLQKGCARRLNQHVKSNKKADIKEQLIGGSYQNLSHLKNDHRQRCPIMSRHYSVGHIASGDKLRKPLSHVNLNVARHQNGTEQYHNQSIQSLINGRPKAESMSNLYLESGKQQVSNSTSMCSSAWTLAESNKEPWTNYTNQELLNGDTTNAIDQKSVQGQDQHNQDPQFGRLRYFSKVNCHEFYSANNCKISKDVGSCFNINAPVAEVTMKPYCSPQLGLRRPSLANTEGTGYPTSDGAMFQCYKYTVDGSENCSSNGGHSTFVQCLNDTQSLLQPHLEQVAIEALQICCLLLPPPSRRKLQLLMRMISRISQNVDMPQLHDAMGTRMLVIHTFSHCILRCKKELDLDELLGMRLVSFLLDHHQEILQVPSYLQNAVEDHINHLQKVQIRYPCTDLNAPVPMYTFCQQISSKEFEEQKLTISQIAIAELLENIVEDKKLSVKDKRKKLKQFQKEYPEIYQNRFPTSECEVKLFQDKPKIKPPLLITMKKPLKHLQKKQSLRS